MVSFKNFILKIFRITTLQLGFLKGKFLKVNFCQKNLFSTLSFKRNIIQNPSVKRKTLDQRKMIKRLDFIFSWIILAITFSGSKNNVNDRGSYFSIVLCATLQFTFHNHYQITYFLYFTLLTQTLTKKLQKPLSHQLIGDIIT